MPTICHFRILTQDLSRGAYHSIPLIGKSSYMLANHTNNRSLVFSIAAYAWDTDTNQAIHNHPNEEMIKVAMETLDHVQISSASGKVYVNIKKFKKEEGFGTRIISAIGGGYFPYALSGIKAIMAFNNLLDTPPEETEEFYFGFTAHPRQDTQCSFPGTVTMGQIAAYVNAHAWPKTGSLGKMANYAKSKVENYGEIKEFVGMMTK